jgi:hypothetical protein
VASVLRILLDALKEARTGAPHPAPAVLAGIPDNPLEIDVSGWDDVQRFLTRWDDLSQEVRDTLVVRVLQQRFPRVAESLVLLGAVRVHYVPGADPARVHAFGIVMKRIEQLIGAPRSEADDLGWWTAKASNPKKLKSLMALLIAAPEPLLALEYVDEGFASLPAEPQSLDLIELIDTLTGSPATITLPTTAHEAETLTGLLQALQNPPPATIGRIEAEVMDGPPGQPGLGAHLHLRIDDLRALAARTVALGDGWTLAFVPGGTAAGPGGDFQLEWTQAGGWNAAVRSTSALTLSVRRPPGAGPDLLIGEDDGTRLEVGRVNAVLRLSTGAGEPSFVLGLALEQAALAFAVPSLLRALGGAVGLPSVLRFSSDVVIDYVQGVGLRVRGGEPGEDGAIAVHVVHPLDLRVGSGAAGIAIERVAARLVKALDARDFAIELRTTATAQIGPLRLTIEDAGAWVGVAGSRPAGGALAPRGIGVVIEAGPVRGGGYLSVQRSGGVTRYAGALSLRLLMLDVFAFGILEERHEGLSFVAVLGVRFHFGIQLGFGFMVTGVGGIVGIHRRADLASMRDRLASGAAGNVLFNDDPAKNAPALLHDLDAFFPAQRDSFVVGPTLQLSWLHLVRLDLGLVIQLPGPSIAVVGSARVLIGASEHVALVYLRMDFMGGIDAQEELIFFDAGLVNSHVLGILDITGGMAFRLAYGSPGYVALSVGGFHPSFNPSPMRIPPLARVGTSLSLSVVAKIYLRTEMYVAFTSNTFQVGAAVEAGLQLGPIAAHGWFRFDALIQFKPFYFQADIDAGFELEVFDVSVASARVQGQLSGPGPITIQARASLKILFVRVSGSVTLRLGPGGGEREERLPSALPLMRAELKPLNVRAEGEDPDVALRPGRALAAARAANGVLVLPGGRVVWEQKLAPLKTPLQRFRGQLLDQEEIYSVSWDGFDSEDLKEEHDDFALGTFATLAPAEALNNALFQPLPSGVGTKEGLAPLAGAGVPPNLSIDLTIVPELRRMDGPLDRASHFLSATLYDMARERDAVPAVTGGPAAVGLTGETWTAVGPDGAAIRGAEAVSPAHAFLRARQAGGFAAAVTDGPVNLTDV